MTKKIYFIFALFIFKVFALYSQNVFDNIYDLDISNKDIKKLILEIKNHLPEIPDNENFIKTKKYELVIYYDEDGPKVIFNEAETVAYAIASEVGVTIFNSTPDQNLVNNIANQVLAYADKGVVVDEK